MEALVAEALGVENEVTGALIGCGITPKGDSDSLQDSTSHDCGMKPFTALVKNKRHQGEFAILLGTVSPATKAVTIDSAFPVYESLAAKSSYFSQQASDSSAEGTTSAPSDGEAPRPDGMVISGHLITFVDRKAAEDSKSVSDGVTNATKTTTTAATTTTTTATSSSTAPSTDAAPTANRVQGEDAPNVPSRLRREAHVHDEAAVSSAAHDGAGKDAEEMPSEKGAVQSVIELQVAQTTLPLTCSSSEAGLIVEEFITKIMHAVQTAMRHQFRSSSRSHAWVDELLWKFLPREKRKRSLFRGASHGEDNLHWHGDWKDSSTWKDDWVKIDLKRREKEYTTHEPLHLCIGTFNVNGRSPVLNDEGDVCSITPFLLEGIESQPDIYAIGFQEMDLNKEAFVFAESKREDEWRVIIANTLGDDYIELHRRRLVGMFLIVFVKRERKEFISDLKSAAEGTGIMNVMGNKGGVALRFRYKNSLICFVTTHLAARTENVPRRNQDYAELCRRLTFDKGSHFESGIFDSEFVFWFGDLNYRIEGDDAEIKAACQNNNIQYLLERDQLAKQRKERNVFVGWVEPAIDFKPTYKYDIGTDVFDTSEKKRSPAYCDRILFWASAEHSNDHVAIREYVSCPAIRISDHKPVRARFTVQTRVIDVPKQQEVMKSILRQLDIAENNSLPDVELSSQNVVFDGVRFDREQNQQLTLKNIGKSPARFTFIEKHDTGTVHASWLRLSRRSGLIIQGEEVTITLTVCVGSDWAPDLNTGKRKLDDVLILHLENGNDFFITVTGTFLPTFLCRPLTDLCHLKEPAREVSVIERSGDFNLVPKEMWLLIDFVIRNGIRKPGLFRSSMRQQAMWVIVECLDEGLDVPPSADPSNVLRVLRLFLSCLPEPIIPHKLYQRCVDNSLNKLLSTKVVEELPRSHKVTFEYLIRFLREILLHKDENGTSTSLLLRVFGPVILRPPPTRTASMSDTQHEVEFLTHFLPAEEDAEEGEGKEGGADKSRSSRTARDEDDDDMI